MLLSLGFLNCHLQPFGFAVEVRRQRRRGLVDQIWGGGGRGYFQKTNQKQPEMVLCAAKITFQISKLLNYMSHVNKNFSRYVPRQHLSFAQKSGWQ